MAYLTKKILVALSLTALVILVIISVFFAVIKLSPTNLQRIAQERIKEITNQEVFIGTAAVQIFMQPKLSLMDVRIGDPDELYVSIKRIDAELSLRHLLFGKTRLINITFNHPSVSLNTNALGKIQGQGKSTKWPSILIVDGYLNLSHEDNELILKELNGIINPDEIDLHTSILGGTAQIQARFLDGWQGKISSDELDLSSLRDDLRGMCALDANFDLTGKKVNASLVSEIRQLGLPWHDKPIAACSLEITAQGTFDHVSVREISLKTPEIQISGSGEIIDLLKKNESLLKLNMKSSDFDYEQIVSLLPTDLFYPWLDTLLTRQIRDGISKFSAIGYEGTVEELFDAKTFFHNAYIVQNLIGQSFGSGYGPERITDITGEVIYGEGEIAVMGLNGLIGDSILDNVDLTFHEVVLPGSKISVAVTADMPAEDFVRTWRAAMVPKNQYRLLSPIKKVHSGRVKGQVKTYIDMTSTGPPQASGDISFESLDFAWGDSVIKGLSGTLHAEDFNAPFDISLSGMVNNRSIERLDCTLHDPFRENRYSFFLKSGPLFQTDTFRLGEGSTIIIEGTGTGTIINASAAIDADRFILFDTTYSPTGKSILTTGRLEGTLWPEAVFHLIDLKPQLPSSDLTISGDITNIEGNLQIKGSIDLGQLNASIDNREHPLSGTVAGDMSIHWGDKTSLSGAVVCNQATFCADGSPLTLDGPIRMSNNILKSDTLKIKSQDITVQITSGLLTLAERPHFTGVLLIDGAAVTQQNKGMSKLLTAVDGAAPIELINLNLYGIPIDSLKAYAELKNGVLDLSGMYLQGAPGNAHGTTSINTAGNSTFDLFISLDKVNIREFLNALSDEEPWIRGTMNLEGHLWGSTDSVNGSLVLTARDGKIQKYALFSRIFALMNIYKIIQSHDIELTSKNFPYNVISSTFTMKDSLLSFDDFYFNSNSLQISAVGKYSLKTKEIDSILGIQPFESFDRAIGMLPLLGWILTGKDKKLIVVSMNVQGHIDDPTVQIAPWDTISNPVKDSLLRAWDLSTDLLKGLRN